MNDPLSRRLLPPDENASYSDGPIYELEREGEKYTVHVGWNDPIHDIFVFKMEGG